MQVIFIIISLITIGSAIVVVTNRNLFHAAMAMMLPTFAPALGTYLDLSETAAARWPDRQRFQRPR